MDRRKQMTDDVFGLRNVSVYVLHADGVHYVGRRPRDIALRYQQIMEYVIGRPCWLVR
jgi:hypothetical protein